MGRPAADDFEDRVAELLELQRRFDDFGIVLGQLQGILQAQEVGRVQHGRVQDVAFDPLAAIDQPAQVADRAGYLDAQRLLHGMAGAHLIGDGADAADARGDVGRVAVDAALQEGLEEPRRLEDAEADVLDLVVLDPDVEGALALDAGKGVDLDRPGRRRLGLWPCRWSSAWRWPSAWPPPWSGFWLAPYSWVKLSCRNAPALAL